MKFRLKRVSSGIIKPPPPVKGYPIEYVPDPWDEELGTNDNESPEYYCEVETLEDLIALDRLAGSHGLIIFFKPTDRGWHRDKQPEINIYDGYVE